MKNKFIIVLSFILLTLFPSMNNTVYAVGITIDGKAFYNIGSSIDICEDKGGTATISQILRDSSDIHFTPSQTNVSCLGMTRSAYWLRFTLNNNTADKHYLLEIPWPLFDDVRFYTIDTLNQPQLLFHTGDVKPFAERPLLHRNFVMNVPLPEQRKSATYFLRVKSNDAIILATYLWETTGFASHDRKSAYLLGLFFGILGVMIVYNLFLSITLRDKLFLYFVFVLVSYFFFELTYTGLGYQYFWPTNPWLQQHILPFSMALCFIAFVIFTRRYLDLHKFTPRLDLFLRAISVLVLLGIPALGFMDTLNSVKALNLLILAVMGVMCMVIPILIRKRKWSVIFYLLIWMPFLFLVSVLVLRNMALIPLPEVFFTEHSAKIGAILQVTLMSIAIGTKMRRERDAAQQSAIRSLEKAEAQLEQFILTLADAIETKDAYTGGHVVRVANYARDISRHLGFSEEAIKQIYLGAIVHDIGKIGIPDLVLNKSGALTSTEFEAIKAHTIMGHRLLCKIEDIHIPSLIALSHQERWDGKGYPHGLRGQDIPIEARIVTIADYWDSIITDRPYRKAMPLENAINIMLSERENSFDPEILSVFIDNRIYLNHLTREQSGIHKRVPEYMQN